MVGKKWARVRQECGDLHKARPRTAGDTALGHGFRFVHAETDTPSTVLPRSRSAGGSRTVPAVGGLLGRVRSTEGSWSRQRAAPPYTHSVEVGRTE